MVVWSKEVRGPWIKLRRMAEIESEEERWGKDLSLIGDGLIGFGPPDL